ncbi:MAG TPA: TspO/MBR family protein [Methanotrichaceae archaeon]|nr:TspO/MBR family protein [Methanotrichaceae archaeon]
MRLAAIGEIFRLIASILIAQSAGLVGAIFTMNSIWTWYRHLNKPEFTPSGQFISAAWVVLYTLMGTASYLVWRSKRPGSTGAMIIYAAQLLVNVLWSGAFFGLRSPSSGLMVIGILWTLILATIRKFWSISRPSALLLVPYLLWTSFAAYLNYSIWRLNR